VEPPTNIFVVSYDPSYLSRTKHFTAAKNSPLPTETAFFNTIGQKLPLPKRKKAAYLEQHNLLTYAERER
jgi:hypothetical protein